jgi:4-amino-4-deoxy-L-arabinose transferase-like glycosyltransferase
MMIRVNPRLRFPILVSVAFILSLLFILWSTPLGVGVSPDSVVYIETARNILSGDGVVYNGRPLTHYPPTYPLILALGGLLSSDPVNGARLLHALLFGLNVLVIGLIAFWSTNKSVTASLTSVLFFLSSARMLDIYTWAWSEPAFILFSFLAFLLLALYISRSSKWLLFGASLFIAAALTTRYIAFTLFPPIVLTILLFGRKRFRDRISDCIILLAIGIIPLSVWLFRNTLLTNSIADRTLAIHPINFTHIRSLLTTTYDFWIPISCSDCFVLSSILFPLAGGLAFVGYLFVVKNEHRGKSSINSVIQTLLVFFAISYVLFLFASITFVDAHTPLDSRIMSPVYISGVIFLISVIWSVSRYSRNVAILWGFIFFSLILIGMNFRLTVLSAIHLRNQGKGYASITWRSSESIAFINGLPKDSIIYSNGPDVIHFLTQREAKFLPHEIDPATRAPNPDFGPKIEAMRADLIQNNAMIIYLDNITSRWYLPTKEELENSYNIPITLWLSDGAVYTIK